MNSRSILQSVNGWNISPDIADSHCDLILEGLSAIDNWLGADGRIVRLSDRLDVIRWLPSPALWQKLGFHHVEFSTVYLDPNHLTCETVVHEFAHILDNRMGSHPLASIFGGGLSDEMVRWLGIEPEQFFPRFYAHCYEREFRFREIEMNPSLYGRTTGPSEDFAESFRLAVMDPNRLALAAPLRNEWFSKWKNTIHLLLADK
jgi:hypothetical protein